MKRICTFLAFVLFFGFNGCKEKSRSEETTDSFNFNHLYKIHQQLGEPLPGEWREAHPELSQPVKSFVQKYTPLPTRESLTIYLLPIGNFDHEQMGILSRTKAYIEVFYGMETRLLDAESDAIIPDSARRFHLNTE